MAKKTGVSIRQSVYKTFRGADFSTDPSLVDYSRSPLCTNIVADGGGMPQKRLGWRKLWQKDKPVYGLFAGRFDGAEKKLAHIGTALYAWDDETAPTEILTGLPERRSRAAYLAGKLWIVTGGRFLRIRRHSGAQSLTERLHSDDRYHAQPNGRRAEL